MAVLAVIYNRVQFPQIKKKMFQFQTYLCSSMASDKREKQCSNYLHAKWNELEDKVDAMVGCKTSSMHLKYFLDETFVELGKSVGNDHPLAKSMKNIIFDSTKDNQPWGLIILLLSTSVTNKLPSEPIKLLAQIVESIKAGFQAHHGIININKALNKEVSLQNNKLYVLLGDYFIARAHYSLAELRNSQVHNTLSTALKILSESEFMGKRDVHNKPVPNTTTHVTDEFKSFDLLSIDIMLGKVRKEWTVRSLFNGVDLLGRGCQSAMMLRDQIPEVQHHAYRFGCHVGLALQAATELQKLTFKNKQYCLVSAPVLFALEENPDLYMIIDQAKNDVEDVDYEDLKYNILKTDAVDKTKMLYEDHAKKATVHIERFGENESVDMLKKFINIM